ncbi:hypothetical protein RBI98_07160 [Citrobacter koseri]|uniref:hypothetical protein n=1 Tax=Citrobacter koseri TaxID=545 RepID=UPI0027C73C90|nr:hypothetical protein [Citrobacter koseri]MDQ2324568.1 hypothetical protein [Citrobacter koseri]WOI92534.1 hypothetical protein R1016_12555 [Citrobacter koseri]WOJ15797.1 hypothetical protein R1018_12530 [Citrobacter koseri]WOJ22186.1 hypothetical protein R1015_01545 [Citrobacter koseri]
MIPESYQGEAFEVRHCNGALKTLGAALKSVTPVNKQRTMLINLRLQIERLASGKRSADLSVRMEGLLPSFKGKPSKNFWAIKKKPLRAYYWDSERVHMTYYISHYIFKNFDKLDDADTQKVCNNWTRVEVNCDEC